jgi:LCP family protein required for cell wall assembly
MDALMVVSVDPVAETASLITVPSDTTRIPLGNGSVFGAKLGTLVAYAERHPEQFPQGGIRALEDAVGALLGLPIQFYARVDLGSFVKLVDAIGGIDVTATHAWSDPAYQFGPGPTGKPGFRVTVGRHHLGGWAALAYARAGVGPTESDASRAARQQAVALAIRDRLFATGGTLASLPTLLHAIDGRITTDLPTDRLPDIVAIVEHLRPAGIYRLLLGPPLLGAVVDPVQGPVRVPNLPALRAAVAAIAPPPGQTPVVRPGGPIATPAATPAATKASPAP